EVAVVVRRRQLEGRERRNASCLRGLEARPAAARGTRTIARTVEVQHLRRETSELARSLHAVDQVRLITSTAGLADVVEHEDRCAVTDAQLLEDVGDRGRDVVLALLHARERRRE